jgi:hypothetical protein
LLNFWFWLPQLRLRKGSPFEMGSSSTVTDLTIAAAEARRKYHCYQ